jgi:hypothetical protein
VSRVRHSQAGPGMPVVPALLNCWTRANADISIGLNLDREIRTARRDRICRMVSKVQSTAVWLDCAIRT